MEAILVRRQQYVFYVVLSLLVLGVTFLLLPSSGAYFRRFFGRANPILVVVVASIAGGISLSFLQTRYGFQIVRGQATLQGIAISAGLATLLGVAIIIADFFIRYPEDTNVPVPQALLFYPAVGFVAEILFHVLPLAIVLLALTPLANRFEPDRLVWLGIAVVAVLEPTFQVMFERKPFSWAAAYTWVHVFVLALLQLYVFQRYDFMSMYSFRLIYYAYWHIIWGVLRLKVLF